MGGIGAAGGICSGSGTRKAGATGLEPIDLQLVLRLLRLLVAPLLGAVGSCDKARVTQRGLLLGTWFRYGSDMVQIWLGALLGTWPAEQSAP